MSETVYIEISLKPAHTKDFSNLCNSDEGFGFCQTNENSHQIAGAA